MNNPGNKKFIYVFNRKDADTLLSLGYTPIKEDSKHNMFIFLYANENQQNFSLASEMIHCLTDTLMF